MIQIETAKTGHFSMDYIRFGDGDEVFVILPGLSVQSVMLSAEAIISAYRLLAENHTVYVFDRRKELPEDYTMVEMADDTEEVLRFLQLGAVNLFGASQGGRIAALIASRHPEQVKNLVLGSPAICEDAALQDTLGAWIRLAEERKAKELYLSFGELLYPPEVFGKIREPLENTARTVTEEELNRFLILAGALRHTDIGVETAKIVCPVLVIGSKDDRVVGGDSAPQLFSCLTGSAEKELYMYDGYGHAAYDTAPDYKERILDFLKRHE